MKKGIIVLEESKKNKLVSFILGSKSDDDYIQRATHVFEDLKIGYEIKYLSAHRDPDELSEYLESIVNGGEIEIIISAAGFAAHLPGYVASRVNLPVIGVPIPSSDLNGLDSLFSIVQMPSGVPVATMTIGRSGAANAAIFAARILALKYSDIRDSLGGYKYIKRK